jgi:hypothetical protein
MVSEVCRHWCRGTVVTRTGRVLYHIVRVQSDLMGLFWVSRCPTVMRHFGLDQYYSNIRVSWKSIYYLGDYFVLRCPESVLLRPGSILLGSDLDVILS